MEKNIKSDNFGNESRVKLPKRRNSLAAHNFAKLPLPDDFDVEGRDAEAQPKPKAQPVTWMSLPRKDQFAILFLARLVDFLQVASLQAYVFYQLKSFDSTLTNAQISTQAGILQGCFTGAQVLTAILWGKAADAAPWVPYENTARISVPADASWCGRKVVLIIGLAGTAVSCLGYGFASSFFWAAFWRAVGGGINGTVGIIRTMIAELTKEKKYQSRTFLILPMSFNVAGILGPIMGGLLADPATIMPDIFGPEGSLGFSFLEDRPYALPSLLNAFFLTITTYIVFFCLEETLKECRGRFDLGLHLKARFLQMLRRRSNPEGYSQVQAWDMPKLPSANFEEKSKKQITRRLPFGRIWTRNVVFTLLTGAFYDFHLGAFTNLWTLFLSTPRFLAAESTFKRSLPFLFTGGLGMPAATIGVATSILGILGMLLQLFLYPPVQARLGTLRSFRYFSILFPLAYFIAPYLAIIPSSSVAPAAAAGVFIWIGIILVLLLQVTARTFTLPATIILLNNCSPHPSVLGTIHGLGQSVSAGFRTVGPVVAGSWYGSGLDIGVVGAAWWGTAIMSAACCVTVLGMHEGSGHEVFLEGEEDIVEAEPLLTEKAAAQAPEISESSGSSRSSREHQA